MNDYGHDDFDKTQPILGRTAQRTRELKEARNRIKGLQAEVKRLEKVANIAESQGLQSALDALAQQNHADKAEVDKKKLTKWLRMALDRLIKMSVECPKSPFTVALIENIRAVLKGAP